MPPSRPSSPPGPLRQRTPVVSPRVAADAARKVALARAAFLDEEVVGGGSVRPDILASWRRSRALQVRADGIDLGSEAPRDGASLLEEVAGPVLDDVADLMATEPMAVILCDADGVVLQRRTGDSELAHHLDLVWLAPGFSYTERNVGTNGIGTSLESMGPAHVFGHEHWADRLEQFSCAAVPVRHPVSGVMVGVVDLTGWYRDGGGLMITTTAMIARKLEEALRARSASRELALLHDYRSACRRTHDAVLAVGDDLLMLNDRARALLDHADQAALVSAAAEALGTGRRSQVSLDLPSGATVRLHCRPTWAAPGTSGGVLQVHPVERSGTAAAAVVPSVPDAVGSAPLWSRCRQDLDRSFGERSWVLLCGEPGSGRRTLARAAHQARTPSARLRVLDAADAGPGWLEEVAAELGLTGRPTAARDAGTLVLADVDRLPVPAARLLAELLSSAQALPATGGRPPWVVATVAAGDLAQPCLAVLAHLFPGTVEVPPLRHHAEDVPALVRHLIARITHGADLECAPATQAVLARHPWPGNVEQLQQVLRAVVTRRRAGVIEVEDLPAEVWSTSRRVLTPLEAMERDAIVDALRAEGGNKVRAARRLRLSRATLYRKIRLYGITTP